MPVWNLLLVTCLILNLNVLESRSEVVHGTWGNLKYTTVATPVSVEDLESNNNFDQTNAALNSGVGDGPETLPIVTTSIPVSETLDRTEVIESTTSFPETLMSDASNVLETTTIQLTSIGTEDTTLSTTTIQPTIQFTKPTIDQLTSPPATPIELTTPFTTEPIITSTLPVPQKRHQPPLTSMDIVSGKIASNSDTSQYSNSVTTKEDDPSDCTSCSNSKTKPECSGSECSKYNIVSNNFNGTFTFNLNVNECGTCNKGKGCHC